MSTEADITIIGAGIVGTAMAAHLAREDREVYVLEQHETFGKEITSRTRAGTHAGWYPMSGNPLKGQLVVPGKRKLIELVDKYELPHVKTQKMIVAPTDEGYALLQVFLERGLRQGVEGLQILSREEIKKLEPNIDAACALFAPNTRRLEPISVMRCFISQAMERGAQVVYNSKVIGVEKIADGYEVTVDHGTERMSFTTRIVINCAGTGSEKVAQLAGIDTDKAGYMYQLYVPPDGVGPGYAASKAKSNLIGKTYSFDTVLLWLGPHPSKDYDGILLLGGSGIPMGRVRVGSQDTYDSLVHKYTRDWPMVPEDEKRAHKVRTYETAKWLFPFLELDDLEEHDIGGLLPSLQYSRGNPCDWTIREESDKGLPGFVNLIGMDAPAFTSCMAIAEYVGNLIKEWL